MKINIISDIHATINNKKRVIYDIPLSTNKTKYIRAMKQLAKIWKSNKEKLVDFDYSKSKMPFFDDSYIKSYDDGEKFLDELVNEQNHSLTPIDQHREKIRKLNELRAIFNLIHIDQTNIKILDIIYWLNTVVSIFDPTRLEPADYLIIAGDLGLSNCYDNVLEDLKKKTEGKFKDIMHIAGNHDHWWIGNSKFNMKRPDKTDFSHDYYEKEDGEYLFLGCTLWTPIDDMSIYKIGRYMNDYHYSPNFTPYASREQYRQQSSWLKKKISENKDKKIVVFTHHQPFEELVENDYKHNGMEDGVSVNEAYAVMDHSLDNINKYGNIKLWCCGHTHQCFDGMLHDVHVVRNPIGYRTLYNYYSAENMSGTWYNKIIEI